MGELEQPNPATLSQFGIQKISLLTVKALLSSIPLATLALDIGQVAVDLANEISKGQVALVNKRITEVFLEDLGERLQKLEAAKQDEIAKSDLHEIAAHAAIRALISETNQRVPVMLSRAVSRLAIMPESSTYKAQCARVLEELSEPMLHALQTNDRYHTSKLTAAERELFAGHTDNVERMALLLNGTMSVPHWDSVTRRIMQLGLIENHIDMGGIVPRIDIVQNAPSTPFGRMIIDLCFEDVSVPVFGRFSN